MRFLLDTHIWIWSLLEPERLSGRVRSQLERREAELWLSPVSVWEALILIERGRIELEEPARDWVDRALRTVPLRDAPLTRDVAIESRAPDVAHEDPADRFLAATAAVYSLTLVTADVRLLHSRRFEVLANT